MPISTNGTVVARFAGALYNQQLSNATYSEVVTWSNTNSLNTLMNDVYTRDFSAVSDNTVAGIIVGNLGLSAIAGTQAYVAAQLTAAGANKGQMLATLLNGFSQMTADPVYGAAATAYNTQVASSQTLSQTAGNAGGNFLAPTAAVTLNLGIAADNLVGTGFNDTFVSRTINGANTLQDGDRIDGGAGVDTVYLDYVSTGNAATPSFRNIESVVIRAQSATTDANGVGGTDGNNQLGTRTVQIDAQRSLATDSANKVTADLGVVNWESSNSRSDVVIEDVRIGNTQKTKDVTITFRESDPGNVDLGVYFDVHSLRNSGTGTSAINIFLMDTAAAAATPATPLLNQNFNTYTFYSNNVKVVLGGTGTAAGAAIDAATTYAQLKDAFVLALKTALVGTSTTPVDLSATVSVTSSGPVNMTTEAAKATESNVVSNNFLNLTGEVITLTSSAAATITSKDSAGVAGGWTAAGPAPSTGAIVQTFNTGGTTTTELVTSKVVLDDVGRGSTGGDLVIGSMSVGDTSTSRGVERFEITVEDSSKLQTINSTNNALREVTIVNGTTSNASSAYVTVATNAGDLTVNGNVGVADADLVGVNNNSTWGAGVNGTGTSSQASLNHSGPGAAGFTDVRLIDASAMVGKFNFTAAVSVDTIGKYINAVDTASSPTSDVAGTGNVNFNVRGANFIYTGGANDDTMVVTLDPGVVASRSTIVSGKSDFTMNLSSGAGNDAIVLNIANERSAATGNPVLLGNTEAWYTNQVLNRNITINGGAGNDTIRKPGAGNATIDAGDGNDTVYTDNSGATSSGSYTTARAIAGAIVGVQESTARWVFNTADQTVAVTPAARLLSDLVSSSNSSYALFNSKLTVSYRGIQASATVENTAYKSSDLQINQAIKAAINNDAVLSKLILATDGPANTLVVTSLSDGTQLVTDLGVALTSPAAATISATDLAAYNTANGTAHADGAALVAALTVINNTLGTNNLADNDYTARFANAGAIVADMDGVASQTTTDNTITPGLGNDVIVLSTTVGATAVASSNETIVYSGLFGNDTIVNFTAGAAATGGDVLNFAALNGSGAVALGNLVLDKSIVIGAPTAVPLTAVAIAALFTDSATAINHVYVAVDTTNIGSIWQVADAAGVVAGNVVATLVGTIDLADTAWATLTAANFA